MTSNTPFSYHREGATIESELEILRALVAGRNPVTGAMLPANSCYHSVKVVRALFAAIRLLEKKAQRNKSGELSSENPFGFFQGCRFPPRWPRTFRIE